MSVKKIILSVIFLSAGAASVSAHGTFRMAGILSGERNIENRNISSDEEGNSRFWGLETEVLNSDNSGFGSDALVNFYTDNQNESMLDWQGQLFIRYHLFDAQNFLDPFIEAGIGNAGTVRLGGGDELKSSLYPFISAGGNLVFHRGVYAGMRWSYKLDEWTVPGATLTHPELEKYQLLFTVGYSYNWHDRHQHNYYNHYHYD